MLDLNRQPLMYTIDVMFVAILIPLLCLSMGCRGENPLTADRPPDVKMWTSARYGGVEPFNTTFYSKVDDNLALVSYYCDVTDTNVTDVSLVLDCLKIVRSDYGQSFKKGTITKDMRYTPYCPEYLVVLVNGRGMQIRVVAIIDFSDAFDPLLNESRIHLVKGITWTFGEASTTPARLAYERFIESKSRVQEYPVSNPDSED
jgi:hypothetical protein